MIVYLPLCRQRRVARGALPSVLRSHVLALRRRRAPARELAMRRPRYGVGKAGKTGKTGSRLVITCLKRFDSLRDNLFQVQVLPKRFQDSDAAQNIAFVHFGVETIRELPKPCGRLLQRYKNKPES